MKFSTLSLCLLVLGGCQPERRHPVEYVVSGWIITCSNDSPGESPSHGLPWFLVNTHPLGHLETLILTRETALPCDFWQKHDPEHMQDINPKNPDYRITLTRHPASNDPKNVTWDLQQVRNIQAE